MHSRFTRDFVAFAVLVFAWPAMGANNCTQHHNGNNNICSTTPVQSSSYTGVFTKSYDNLRTNLDPNETYLTTQNVQFGQFGKVQTFPTDAYVYAQPLYVSKVNIPNKGPMDVLYVATEGDSVYAFDASGKTQGNLWANSKLSDPSGAPLVPLTGTGAGSNADVNCQNIAPYPGSTIGINGTPVIDPNSSTLYVVTVSKDALGGYHDYLHALDLATGAEKFGGPKEIKLPSQFSPKTSSQHQGLALANGNVYIAYSSNCDEPTYSGLVLVYSALSLSQLGAYQTTATGYQGGIWSLGSAPAIGPNHGNIYFSTGNGAFDGARNFGNSIIKLSPSNSGAPNFMGFFSPFDQDNMNTIQIDLDLGSGGVMVLPDQGGAHPHLLIAGGKSGQIYLIDRDTMGDTGYDPNDSTFSHIVQSFNMDGQPYGQAGVFQSTDGGIYSSPAYFNHRIYYAPSGDTIRAYQITNGQIVSPATAVTGTTEPVDQSILKFAWPGGTPTISADGTNNAILWFVNTHEAYANNGNAQATLYAYDANNLSAGYIFNSDQTGVGCTANPDDQMGPAVKHVSPTVYNGNVYVGTKTGVDMYTTFAHYNTPTSDSAQTCKPAPVPTPAPTYGAVVTMQYDAAASTCVDPTTGAPWQPNGSYNFRIQYCNGPNDPPCAAAGTVGPVDPVPYLYQYVDLKVGSPTTLGDWTPNDPNNPNWEIIHGRNSVGKLIVEQPTQFAVTTNGFTQVTAKFYCQAQ